MTEQEWLSCGEYHSLFQHIYDHGLASSRKLRLAVCGCYRLTPGYVDSPTDHQTLEHAEQAIDAATETHAPLSDYLLRGIEMDLPVTSRAIDSAMELTCNALWDHEMRVASAGSGCGGDPAGQVAQARHVVMWVALIREIFGNPFRPVALDAAWRTSDVMLLAQGIYDEKAFDRMPILADALQDAGCDNADILNHLRDPKAVGEQGAEAPRTPHVRGCWALDLVLGKE